MIELYCNLYWFVIFIFWVVFEGLFWLTMWKRKPIFVPAFEESKEYICSGGFFLLRSILENIPSGDRAMFLCGPRRVALTSRLFCHIDIYGTLTSRLKWDTTIRALWFFDAESLRRIMTLAKQSVLVRIFFFSNLSRNYCCDLKQQYLLHRIGNKIFCCLFDILLHLYSLCITSALTFD